MIAMIAAIAANNAIGFENKLLYWLPDDLKRFKSLTTGHTIIMGRKTFESLPKGALPNRRNIVLSKNPSAQYAGTEVFHSLEQALQQCSETENVFIIGGESLYKEGLSKADRLYLTTIEDTPEQADAFSLPSTNKNGNLYIANRTLATKITHIHSHSKIIKKERRTAEQFSFFPYPQSSSSKG